MKIKSKKGVKIYHEYYLNLELKGLKYPEIAKIPVESNENILKWNKTVGDRVKKYDVIAIIKDEIPIYSPFSGLLTEIVTAPKIGELKDVMYAVIKTEYDNLPSYPICKFDGELTKQTLLSTLKKAAVVDELRKQYFYYTLMHSANFKGILIDGFDDEPYNLSQTATVLNLKNEVYEGAKILAQVLKIKNISLLMNKNFQTNTFLNTKEYGITKITVCGKYPTEPEVLKYAVKNSCLRVGASTCRAIYRAIYFGEPQLERVVTVWGDGISEPSVSLIPFGIPAEHILKEFCAFGMIERVVSGGVMTGHASSLNFPIYNFESSLTVMPLKKHHKREECMNCGRCAISCPLGLAPFYMLRTSKFKGVNTAKELCAGLCNYCGACAYACPSRIPLVDIIRNYSEKEKE